MSGLVDSHAHVSTPRYDEDREQVLARAREAGLRAIVDVGCDLASSRAALDLAQADPLVWAVVGVHPHEARHWDADHAPALRELSRHPRVVALGEMGLDFHYNYSPPETQREVFRAQLDLARELSLPVVLHLREGYDEALQILSEFPQVTGVAHCFTGDATQAAAFAARGFGVSFTGVVTFKSAHEVREAARVVPPELLLVETDCPYMAPVPLRGKRCEPSHVVHTARSLAETRGEDPQELFARTAANAARIFGLEIT
jgi:TatD DNase family protein